MLVDTRMRVSELANIKLEDIETKQGRIKVMGKAVQKSSLWKYCG
jgi:site-specific recombinase XerD